MSKYFIIFVTYMKYNYFTAGKKFVFIKFYKLKGLQEIYLTLM